MFLSRTEYDRGVNTFSPEGRLLQAKYAIEAIKLGSTAIGLKTEEGVVLAVEKRITSPLLEPSSVEKIMKIDEHIGCAMSGLIADAQTLVEHARVESQIHRLSYGEPMRVESTARALCDLVLRFWEGDDESMSRSIGVSLLIAGHDENGPSLYYIDPSGKFWQCSAKVIGSEGAESSLEKQYRNDLTFREAETIALSILKQVMVEKVTPNNVDIAKVSPTYHLYTPSEVEVVIDRLRFDREKYEVVLIWQKIATIVDHEAFMALVGSWKFFRYGVCKGDPKLYKARMMNLMCMPDPDPEDTGSVNWEQLYFTVQENLKDTNCDHYRCMYLGHHDQQFLRFHWIGALYLESQTLQVKVKQSHDSPYLTIEPIKAGLWVAEVTIAPCMWCASPRIAATCPDKKTIYSLRHHQRSVAEVEYNNAKSEKAYFSAGLDRFAVIKTPGGDPQASPRTIHQTTDNSLLWSNLTTDGVVFCSRVQEKYVNGVCMSITNWEEDDDGNVIHIEYEQLNLEMADGIPDYEEHCI